MRFTKFARNARFKIRDRELRFNNGKARHKFVKIAENSQQCTSIAIDDDCAFLQLVNKSEVVRRSLKELQKGAGGSRPSLFVANRPMPEKPPPPKKLPIHAYK